MDNYYRHESRERELDCIAEKKRNFEAGLAKLFTLTRGDLDSFNQTISEMAKNGDFTDWTWLRSEVLNLSSFPIQETADQMTLNCFFAEAKKGKFDLKGEARVINLKIMFLTAKTFDQWKYLYFEKKYRLAAAINMIKIGTFKNWNHWYYNGSSTFSSGVFALIQMKRLVKTEEEKNEVHNITKKIKQRLRQNGDVVHYQKYKKLKLIVMKFF